MRERKSHKKVETATAVSTRLYLPAIPVTAAIASVAATTATTTAAAVAAAAITAAAGRASEALLLETITAIDRAIFARKKWNRRLFSAGGADGFVLLAASTTRALIGGLAVTAGLAALWTTAGGVCQAFACKKLLLAGSKREILATITAGEDAVLVALVGRHG